MAYVTGTANSLADLLTAIQNACTASGWTLSGNVIHKGTCYIEVKNTGTYIQIQGGAGIDGSNNLTGRADTGVGLLGIPYKPFGRSIVSFVFPVLWEVFINTTPDEVYVHVTFGPNCNQQIGFGQSAMPGLTGTGNWYAGASLGAGGYYGWNLQWCEYNYSANQNSMSILMNAFPLSCGVDHRLDSVTWALASPSAPDIGAVIGRQPSQWNGETTLIPVRVYASRLSGFYSTVLECAHLRAANIANLTDGQIITIGSDRWKVYPIAQRGSGFAGTDGSSWYAGHAFRYDGP